MDTITAFSPARPYDPDSGKINLETKICRHLRSKGWKFSRDKEMWVDPKDKTLHTFTASIDIQLLREKRG